MVYCSCCYLKLHHLSSSCLTIIKIIPKIPKRIIKLRTDKAMVHKYLDVDSREIGGNIGSIKLRSNNTQANSLKINMLQESRGLLNLKKFMQKLYRPLQTYAILIKEHHSHRFLFKGKGLTMGIRRTPAQS